MLVNGKTYVSTDGSQSLEVQGAVTSSQDDGVQLFLCHYRSPESAKGYYIYGRTGGPADGRNTVYLRGTGSRRQRPNPESDLPEDNLLSMLGAIGSSDENGVPQDMFLTFTRFVDGDQHQEAIHVSKPQGFTLKA